MEAAKRLTHVIRRLRERPPLLQPAEVLSVDEAQKTCALKLVASGLEVEEARLQALSGADSYFFVRPKDGSHVLVAQLGEEWVVLLTSEVERIELRGSAFGGLIKIEALTAKVNDAIAKLNSNISQLQSDLSTLSNQFKTHTHLSAAPGSPTGLIAASTPPTIVTPPATLTDAEALSRDDYENTAVSHA